MKKITTRAAIDTVTAIEDFIKNTQPSSFVHVLDNGNEVQLKTSLSLPEISGFVDFVTNSCFTAEGDYVPEFEEIMFQSAAMQLLTNLPIPKKSDASIDNIRAYNIMIGLDITGIIAATPNGIKLLTTLRECVHQKIEFKKAQILNTSILEEKIAEFLDSVIGVVNKLDESIDMSTIQKVLPKIEKMTKLDEKKLVDAVIGQMKTRNARTE